MNEEQLLDIFEEFIATLPGAKLDNFAQQPVAEVINTSIDMVEFFLHIEEKLELEEELDMATLASKFGDLTFEGLAQEITEYLAKRGNLLDT